MYLKKIKKEDIEQKSQSKYNIKQTDKYIRKKNRVSKVFETKKITKTHRQIHRKNNKKKSKIKS